ncbi:uncharacterized protein EHS24_000066 [Apiotrichum porosum]|uniref:BHLH domain-containing protein n=1 Tax=Apiotrichum porosum TaxID=105984 RepID=A0A427Y8W8_9TREE|nr:uncharacterized protein EHS24_000066 [Apiotrichum porosum]RSH87556.1 hypothetical protein EHS24_000066 [Apiotrichum porosum]
MTSPLPLSVSPLDQGHPLMSPAINKAAHRQELPLESEDDETKGVEAELPGTIPSSQQQNAYDQTTFVYPTAPPTAGNLPTPAPPHFYHPYRVPQSHPSQSPPTPMTTMMTTSPATSMIVTPPSSASSYIQQLPINNYSPQTISPGMNALNHQMPDLSQSSMPWGYTPNIGYTTVPFPNSNGYAYPAHPQFHMPIKVYNKKEAIGMGMGESGSPDKDDHEEELVDMEDPDDAGCLGFTANDEDRILLPAKREDIRRARIESEQRRRNELREGFDRLRDALPASSQRTSKSAILDRAVAHIQQVEASNRFMSEAFEGLRREIDELRVLNNKLVTAMTHAPGSAEASPRTASLS